MAGRSGILADYSGVSLEALREVAKSSETKAAPFQDRGKADRVTSARLARPSSAVTIERAIAGKEAIASAPATLRAVFGIP